MTYNEYRRIKPGDLVFLNHDPTQRLRPVLGRYHGDLEIEDWGFWHYSNCTKSVPVEYSELEWV